MILFIDSFSYGDGPHQVGSPSFLGFLQSCKYVNYSSTGSGGGTIQVVASAGNAFALRFANNGFEQQTITRMLGVNTSFCVGFLYRPSTLTSQVLVRFEGGPTIVNPGGGGSGHDGGNLTSALTLHVSDIDGTISLYYGAYGTNFAPGTLLWNSAGVYTVVAGVAVYIELQVNTSAGSWSLYIGDVLIQSQTGQPIPAPIDRVSFRAEGFDGWDLANVYITSGERLGPCRVNGFPPTFGSSHQWSPLSGTNLSQVSEFSTTIQPTPDDDHTFVETATAAALDTFGFPAPTCYGLILALALNVDARQVSGTPTVDWIIQQNGSNSDLGTSPALLGNYSIQQGISALNPVSGNNWTDADISSALFGYELSGSGDARVTQFMLEKLVSLRAVPFNCGQGSYSYTS